jgi:RNase P subunit RPR2
VAKFDNELASAQEQLELAQRKIDVMESMSKQHRAELAAKRSKCQDADQLVQQKTHLQNIASLLALVNKGLLDGHDVESLKSTLPFATLQGPSELATQSNLDYQTVKNRTCRQYVGIARHIFLFGYQFSMAYTQMGPDDRQPIVLTTKASKTTCRGVVCKLLNIAHSSTTSGASIKRKRRSSMPSLSKNVRVETVDELLSFFSAEEINAAKAAPGSVVKNFRSIHRKKSTDHQVQSQGDSCGDTKPDAI